MQLCKEFFMSSTLQDIAYIEKTVNTDTLKLIQKMDKGLDYKLMPMLMELLDLSAEDMSGHIEVSMRTLHERKNAKHFNKRESERLVRLARLFLKALEVFESPAFVQEWLKSPKPALGGRMPLDFARTEVGAREVEDLLGRIEHGVFS